MAAGLVWNLGNIACIMAVTDPHVGLAIAMPIMQVGGVMQRLGAERCSCTCCYSRLHLCCTWRRAERPAACQPTHGFRCPCAPPCLQTGLFVAGIWGICLLGEIRGPRSLALYWLSGGLLVGGAALLAGAKED